MKTKQNTKIELWPMIHDNCGRVTRTTWIAALTSTADDAKLPADATRCPHIYGHKTEKAAQACGNSMWNKLED